MSSGLSLTAAACAAAKSLFVPSCYTPFFVVFPFRFALWAKYAASLRSAAETERVRCSAAVCPRSCRFRTAYGKQQRAYISPPQPLVTAAGAAVRCFSAEGRKATKRGRRKDCEGSSGRLSLSSPPPNPPLSSSSPPFFSLSYGVRKKLTPQSGDNRYFPSLGGGKARERLSARKSRPPPCRRSALSCYPLSLLAPFRLLCWLRAALVHRQRGRVPPPAGGGLGVATPKNPKGNARRLPEGAVCYTAPSGGQLTLVSSGLGFDRQGTGSIFFVFILHTKKISTLNP